MPVTSVIPPHLTARTQRDFAIISRLRTGPAEAVYAELLTYYQLPIQRHVSRFTRLPAEAEDLTMEVFVRAFRHLAKFQPSHTFSGWLYRIATNCGIDFARRQRLKVTSLDAVKAADHGQAAYLAEPAAPDRDPQEALMHEQKLAHVRHCIGQLPRRDQQLVQLHYMEEMTYNQIAKRLRRPAGTIKAQLHYARKRLAPLLAPLLA